MPRQRARRPNRPFPERKLKREPVAYTLDITPDEWNSIAFVGDRYSWSAALGKHDRPIDDDENVKPLDLTEAEAWELCEAFEADTAGGHQMFPMLDHRSDLASKLQAFLVSII